MIGEPVQGQPFLRFQATRDRAVVYVIAPELDAIIICAEAIGACGQRERHLPIPITGAMETGIALAREDVHGKIRIRRPRLALHRDGHGNRHRDRRAQAARDRAVVGLAAPELGAACPRLGVQVGVEAVIALQQGEV
jgi:hypothetical protein